MDLYASCSACTRLPALRCLFTRVRRPGFAEAATRRLSRSVSSSDSAQESRQPTTATDLCQLYEQSKESAGRLPLQAAVVNARSVFANNELHLGQVSVYGFDYDYTLAVYRRTLNNLIYSLAIQRLVRDYKVRVVFIGA